MATSDPSRVGISRLYISVGLLLGIIALLALAWPRGGLWYDEALTTYVATDSWQTLWHWVTQVDIQVPFHYVLLRLWTGLAGNSEVTLRALSALCIPLAAAGTIASVRRLTRWQTPAWIAGILVGTLPGVFWIAYEVRAYATALALYAWATAFLIALMDWVLNGRSLPLRQRWMILGYAALMAATLYTHYTAMGAFVGHLALVGFVVVEALIRKGTRRARLGTLILSIALAGIAFLPWIPVVFARGAADRSFFPGDHILPSRSLEVMAAFTMLGRQDQPNLPEIARTFGSIYEVLIGLGLLGVLSQRIRGATLKAVILAVVPLVLVMALLYVNPKLTGRYFWPAWIGLNMLAAIAVTFIAWRRTAPALALTIVLVALPWLSGERGKSPESDYRGAFAFLCTEGTPDDVILLRDGTLFVTADYYGKRAPCDSPRKTYGMPDALITDVTRYLSLGETQGVMKEIAERKPPNVWVIAWQGDIMDPQGLTYALLDATSTHSISTRMFGDVRLDRYTQIDAQALAEMSIRGPLPFASWLNLKPSDDAPTLIATRWFTPDRDAMRPLKAGDKIVIQAWWSRGTRLYPELRVSPRLTTLDQGWTYTQDDQPPAGWHFYDDRWDPAVPALGRYELTIGPDVPAGKIAVRYNVYDTKGRWAPISIPLGEIVVSK